jgi:hypothetical protein
LGIAIALAAGGLFATALPAAAQDSSDRSRTVVAVGTGRPFVDIAVLRRALIRVGPDGTLQLVGTFNLTGCVACLLIRDGITVEGADQGGRPAEATLVGGSFPFIVAVRDRGERGESGDRRDRGGSGNLTLQRLHFSGQLGTTVYFFKTVAQTKVLDNTVTNLNPITLLDGRRSVRGAMLAAQFFPNDAGIRDEIRDRFPAFASVMDRFGREHQLQGNFTFSRNRFDLITPAMSFGVDTTLGMFGDDFSKLTIENNELASYGETIEIEFGRNPDGVRNIRHNTITMVSIEVFESELFGVGNPAAISLEASQARVVNIVDNDVITSGTENGTGIGGGTANEATRWRITGNRIQTAGQIPFPGGFHGLDPFFTGSSMVNTLYKDNSVSGTAKYGFWFDTDNNFDPTSHGNTLGPNDFSGFTPTSGTTVFLGPQTFKNTITGPLNGGVIDQGTDNVVVP